VGCSGQVRTPASSPEKDSNFLVDGEHDVRGAILRLDWCRGQVHSRLKGKNAGVGDVEDCESSQ